MKKTKTRYLHSVLALLLCFSMLLSSTFAWFSDSISGMQNIITAGNLDLEMYWTDDLDSGEWYNVEDSEHDTIFNDDNWEPGYTEVKYIKLKNAGDLALNYQLSIDSQNVIGKLAEVINVYYSNEGTNVENREDLTKLNAIGLLSNVMNGGVTANGTLLAAEQESPLHTSGEVIITLAMSMITSAGNEYQSETFGDGFTITALATQAPFEEDGFGADYDGIADLPVIIRPGNASSEVFPVDGKVPEGGITLSGSGVSAFVPEGTVLEEGVEKLTLTVVPLEHTTSDITIVNNEILIPLDVHIEGVSDDNTVPIIIDLGEVLPKYLNMGNYHLFHLEDGVNNEMVLVESKDALTAHNQFTYHSDTGEVSVAMASFSEVALVADTANEWNGEYAYDWYGDGSAMEYIIANADELAGFGKIVGGMAGEGIPKDSFEGKTVKLIADINLADGAESDNGETKIFYPIGYYNSEGKYVDRDDAANYTGVSSSVNSFEGVFDGNGHAISHFYQNTWDMFGDYNSGYTGTPNYYKDAMGLFGYVYGGTVKNLTVDDFSSDGEFTPTGVIAAYAADAAFENIAITNCNPRVYNTGNGGIIGIAGNTSSVDETITLRNITVDNTNKISALWGSWDVACGGLVGMFRGNADSNGNATGNTIHFENCHVAAQIDVHNDVCANYQYYAYRYAGMIIGSIRHNMANEDGKSIPNMAGITATGCTVNYGDWNDYYYCELEHNTSASYSEDYQFSRLEKVTELPDSASGTHHYYIKNADGTITCRHFINSVMHEHTDKEDKVCVYLPFNQMFTGYGWGVNSQSIDELAGIDNLGGGITESDKNESEEKFVTKFTGDFLYRVGNQNSIRVSSLFAEIDGANINDSGVYVRIDKLYDEANVSCAFTADMNEWENGTLQFTGTGVVDIVIQDYDYCTPTVLHLEVVDAKNTTTAASATANSVVLLNDCGFSSVEVSDGYTLFGNGFTLTCESDSAAADMGYAFVTLNNGVLDNVQIVCPNFDYAALYKSNLTSEENRSLVSGNKTYYYNARSGVMASGNSQILNSRISGARAAVNVSGGNVVIDNSRIELGAVASVLVGSANSLTLRNVTLVQKPTVSTYDSSKTLMGFSVLAVCDSNGDSAPITLEGTLIQNAWIDESDAQYVPSEGQSMITAVLRQTDFLHDIDGDGTNESLNLGIAYMPESLTSAVDTTTITDNRTNKEVVPYEYAEISILNGKTYVYSYKNTNGTDDSIKDESEYVPDAYGDIITVTYSDMTEGLTTGKTYGSDGWIYELNVDLDKANGYALDFSKLSMSVNGVPVTDFKVNGDDKPISPITVTAGGTNYILTATVNGEEYTVTFKVTGTETSKESPSLAAGNYEDGLCVASSYGGTWHGAAPVLEGIQIKYWSVAEQQYKAITLSDCTPTTSGKQNETNNTWTYTPDNSDFTLTVTGGQVHSSNNVYAMPVVCDSKLYFVAASSKGLVNSGNSARSIPISYSFKDNNNGDELTFSHTWSVEETKEEQYNYSDFCNGTLTKLETSSSGGTCVTPDTLVTMADGTKKRIGEVTYEDQLLVWDFYEGAYSAVPSALIVNHGYDDRTIIELTFSDGTTVKAITAHAFFDADTNEWELLDTSNACEYIGHSFVKADGDRYRSVDLVNVEIYEDYTESYSLVSVGHYNFITEDMFSLTNSVHRMIAGLEVGGNMTYDPETLENDVEQHGLYTYADFEDYITYEQYLAFNGDYLKISVEKGYITFDEILALIREFL